MKLRKREKKKKTFPEHNIPIYFTIVNGFFRWFFLSFAGNLPGKDINVSFASTLN